MCIRDSIGIKGNELADNAGKTTTSIQYRPHKVSHSDLKNYLHLQLLEHWNDGCGLYGYSSAKLFRVRQNIYEQSTLATESRRNQAVITRGPHAGLICSQGPF